MKKYMILFSIMILTFSGCSSDELRCGEHSEGESWAEDCNTCTCENGEAICTEIACEANANEEPSLTDELRDELFAIKFNSNLTEFEQKWLEYLEMQNPNSRIIHIKSDVYTCIGCYDLYFKKDRSIIKIKVLNEELKLESTINDDIAPLIVNAQVCALFGGNWNDCPSPCSTDEQACITMCNPPICEFDENAIILKQEGDVCGGLDQGDCAFGLSCYYAEKDDSYGLCQKN